MLKGDFTMRKIGSILLFIFLTGLFTGLFFSTCLSTKNTEALSALLLTGITTSKTGFLQSFLTSLLTNFMLFFLMLPALLSRCLCPLPPLVLWYKSFAIRGCAILLALVGCAVVTMLLTGENPVNIFATIFKGAFGSARKSWVTFQNLAVLLGISLAVTPAFKMRFWNIGAEGQVLIGCLATAACMICLADKLPNAVLILVSLAAALAAGALWGFLPAFFKAKWNTNETLFTLMMNYIATQLAAFFIIVWEVPKGAGKIGIINQGTEAGWLPVVGGQKYLLVILVVAVLTVFMYIYLNYSKHGYEIAVVGESQRTASYAGIKVERVIVRTMVLSGAVCGLMGLLLTAGTDHTLTTTIVGGRGFTAVMVSWMAKFNPIIMIFTSLLLVVLGRGASEISSTFGLNQSFSDILTGIILFFIIGSEFFITYQVSLRKSGKKEA